MCVAVCVSECVCVFVACVCVCVTLFSCIKASTRVCVCVREREKSGRERAHTHTKYTHTHQIYAYILAPLCISVCALIAVEYKSPLFIAAPTYLPECSCICLCMRVICFLTLLVYYAELHVFMHTFLEHIRKFPIVGILP